MSLRLFLVSILTLTPSIYTLTNILQYWLQGFFPWLWSLTLTLMLDFNIFDFHLWLALTWILFSHIMISDTIIFALTISPFVFEIILQMNFSFNGLQSSSQTNFINFISQMTNNLPFSSSLVIFKSSSNSQ
jgi:hypothetical protein